MQMDEIGRRKDTQTEGRKERSTNERCLGARVEHVPRLGSHQSGGSSPPRLTCLCLSPRLVRAHVYCLCIRPGQAHEVYMWACVTMSARRATDCRRSVL